ncbi:Uncharacterised protein [Chryseobacterium taihuense]|uniref:Uncharacterized protein n=2 Tax=Chryseobacterium group TaxID=2782232 RepID=A0A4V6IDH7_9FLAO|nr:Uncharacterised protein [Chryseobacterium taihuense]
MIILLAFIININIFSQMKMADIENREFSINLKTEKRNLLKVFDDNHYSIYYILDKRDFDFKVGSSINSTANVIFFSKKYNKSILTVFRQNIYHKKKSIYDIKLSTGSHDKYMLVSSMAILDENFDYEYFMKYSYMSPPEEENYTSWITIQNIKDNCNTISIDLKNHIIYENIDNILDNISKVSNYEKIKNCDSIIYNRDFNEYFPKKIIK